MFQIYVYDMILERVVWDSISDGHFDEKFKGLPLMIQKIYLAWEKECYSFHETHGEKYHDSLSFEFGGFRYTFSDVYWD